MNEFNETGKFDQYKKLYVGDFKRNFNKQEMIKQLGFKVRFWWFFGGRPFLKKNGDWAVQLIFWNPIVVFLIGFSAAVMLLGGLFNLAFKFLLLPKLVFGKMKNVVKHASLIKPDFAFRDSAYWDAGIAKKLKGMEKAG